jgi:hypothetical protein
MHWSCLGPCAALWDDFGAGVVECWAQTGCVSVMHSWMCGWAWAEGHGESSRIMAGADAGPKAAAAACSAGQWCAAVHEASCPGGLVSFPCWCIGWLLCLDASDKVLLLIDALRPSQTKVLTGGGDLREALVYVPCLLAIPAFDRVAGLNNRHLNSNKGIS